ncbi:MAG: hypothetical protein FWG50_10800, partial [Kiritimatiellaeota bacterium]|nr:hypothetical protein [Kiritimatiellota bacterium]
MKTKALFFISLCLLMAFAAAEEKPARNYSFVDMQNGLTCQLLVVGTNSFTFSVEWTPDVEFPEGLLCLMGNFDVDTPWWSYLLDLGLNPAQGKATFEVRYDALPWYAWEDDKARLEQQAFFHVVVPDPNEANAWIIEEVRKEMEAEKNAEKAAREMGQAHVETTAGQTPDMNGGQSGAVPPEPPHPGKVEG